MNRSKTSMRKAAAITLTALFLAGTPLAAYANITKSKAGPRKVVLIAVDNISWNDLKGANDDNFNRLIETGTAGLLNVRVHRGVTRDKEYVSIGAGARADAADEALAFNTGEPYEGGSAGEAFERRSGGKAPKEGIVTLNNAEIALRNKKLYYDVLPGSLGDSLKAAGKRVAVIGNADISMYMRDKNFSRKIAYLAMTSEGSVEFGDVGKSLLKADPSAPYGVRTNERMLEKKIGEYLNKVDFIAVDFGDTVRADMYDGYANLEASWKMKEAAIARAGRLAARVKEMLSEGDLLIVASLNPPGTGIPISRGYEEQLTPVILSGAGYAAGYLTSEGTHRKGLVANTDIAPTILNAFGIETPVTMYGRPMSSLSSQGGADPDYLVWFNERAMGVNSARTDIIACFAIIMAIALVGTVAALLLRDRLNWSILKGLLKVATLTIVSFPLSSFLFSYYLGGSSPLLLTLSILLGAVLLAYLAQLIGKEGLKPAAILASATLVFEAIDMATGANFNVDTVFGYDTIVGGRFYGMGNESYAVALGAAIIIFAYLGGVKRAPVRNISILALGLGFAFLVGFSRLGANLTGVPPVIASAITFLMLSNRKKPRATTVVLGVAALALSLAAFVGLDLLTGSTTHIGRTADLISNNGFDQVVLLIQRRLASNLAMFETRWTYLLLVIVPVAAFLRFRPVGLMNRVFKDYPTIAVGFSAALGGGLVGYLVEDSGIVVPAIILGQFLPVVVYAMLSAEFQGDAALGREGAGYSKIEGDVAELKGNA